MLVALAAVCEGCCGVTLFAGCFMEMSVAVEGGGVSYSAKFSSFITSQTLYNHYMYNNSVLMQKQPSNNIS